MAKKRKRDAASRKQDTEGRLTFRIDPVLKKTLETLAAAEGRSLSNYVHWILERHAGGRGA